MKRAIAASLFLLAALDVAAATIFQDDFEDGNAAGWSSSGDVSITSLQAIGLTAIFHLPWNLKFLWGPFVDEYETKRRWLLAIEIALSAMLLLLAFTVGVTDLLAVMSAVFPVSRPMFGLQ